MHDSKLISILKSLSKKEFRDFGRFVYSPFFNRLNNVIKLFDILKRHYPKFSSQDLTEEKICDSVFPGEKFDYSKFKNLVSDLMWLAEEYLALKRYNMDDFGKKKYLLDELHSGTLINSSKITKKRRGQFKRILLGEEYYHMNYQLHCFWYSSICQKRFSSENRCRSFQTIY
jgi:hypothetical protein